MFKRKDILRSMFLLLLMFTIMMTLSQILVVHQHKHHDGKQRDVTKLRNMLRELERNIDLMLKKDALPLDKYEKTLQAMIYSKRIADLVQKETSFVEISGTFYRRGTVDDEQYHPQTERKSRVLQHVDITKPSNEPKKPIENIYRKSPSKTKNQSKSILASVVNMNDIGWKELRNDIESDRDKDNNRDDLSSASTRLDLISVHRKGSTKPKYEGILTKRDKYIENKCPNVPVRLENVQYIRYKFYSRSFVIHGNQTFTKTQCNCSAVTAASAPLTKLPICNQDAFSSKAGPVTVDLNISESDIAARAHHNDLHPGGAWQPRDCISKHRVAIVIPYRDRLGHLRILLHFLIPVLQRQKINFRIFVVEQQGNGTFNKGRIMNAAFKEAWKIADFDCFIFHDVDLIPEDDRNMYTCPDQPRHMSPSVDKFGYVLPYKQLVGGVFSIRREHFIKVNGYSNLYWGWGAEDDDMFLRMDKVGLKLLRPAFHIGRYKMIRHSQRELAPAKWRQYLLKTVKKRFRKDGLNSIEYKVTFINNTQLFTHIMVDVGKPPTEVPNISKMMQ